MTDKLVNAHRIAFSLIGALFLATVSVGTAVAPAEAAVVDTIR